MKKLESLAFPKSCQTTYCRPNPFEPAATAKPALIPFKRTQSNDAGRYQALLNNDLAILCGGESNNESEIWERLSEVHILH